MGHRKYSVNVRDEALRLSLEGFSNKEVGKRMGVPPEAVREFKRAAGHKRRPGGPIRPPDDRSLAAAYHIACGAKRLVMAKKYGIPTSSIHKIVERSVIRECMELAELPDGSEIETCWDYQNDESVINTANRYHVYPGHVVTRKFTPDPGD